MQEDKKVLLSVKDLEVKFNIRGRVLTAIRGISLDVYENESIAIVGESGSGKSVFTKTFAGMLDDNGFISKGDIILNDDELADTIVLKSKFAVKQIDKIANKLNQYSKYEVGAEVYRKIVDLQNERNEKMNLSEEEQNYYDENIENLKYQATELFNTKQTYDSKLESDKIKEVNDTINSLNNQIKSLEKEREELIKKHKETVLKDTAYNEEYNTTIKALKETYNTIVSQAEISIDIKERNAILAREIYLSIGRYGKLKSLVLSKKLLNVFKEAMLYGTNIEDETIRNEIFDKVVFRVKYLDEDAEKLHGVCVLNLAKVKFTKDWQQIRGQRVATVFQDPMSSLNPIISIGSQITSVILKHQNCTELEARRRAVELMKKVGIPEAEKRFDDYPFQYSGGMRQRIVIAIALSCQPKILICDEPTTALDVTIQAQILKLIKDLQKEFNYTIVFITHDLGVVANIADRVAVLYSGQIVEVGTVEEVFYDPRHPYTWALLSSLPQLASRDEALYSISGTPPSLYNKIIGDPFAPRNPYCLKIDTIIDSPMFKVSDTHYAKTWLLDPRSPKIEKPKIIQDIHTKLTNAFNIEEVE